MRKSLLVVFTFVAFGGSAAAPAPLNAQDCGTLILNCTGSGAEDIHKVTDIFPTWGNAHEECLICWDGGPVGWEFCHDSCFTPDEDASVVAALMDAVERRNVRHVLAVAHAMLTRVTYNPARLAVQVMDCRGAIVASLAVEGDLDLIAAAESYAQIRGEHMTLDK